MTALTTAQKLALNHTARLTQKLAEDAGNLPPGLTAIPITSLFDLDIGALMDKLTTLTAAEVALLVGLTATAAELNNAADKSLQTQALIATGAITVDGSIRHVTLDGGAYAFTLAAPSAAMKGEILVIEYIGTDTDANTLALTNVIGGTAATSALFNAQRETLVLLGLTDKWLVLKEQGVTLS